MNPPDELYTVEPGAFIAARNAMVKELRQEGRREEADQVGRLRRPTATAWALNQVARDEPASVQAVLDAGAALRAATKQAVSGAGDALRAARAGERDSLRVAVDRAISRLGDAGQTTGDVARQRLIGTLRAAMVDNEVAARLAAGTLDSDHEAPGLGIPTDPGLVVVRPDTPAGSRAGSPPPPPPPPPPDPAAQARKRKAEAEVRRLEQQADRLTRRAQELSAAADQAQAEAEEALARLAAAREQAVD
jgi:hypothetical protein